MSSSPIILSYMEFCCKNLDFGQFCWRIYIDKILAHFLPYVEETTTNTGDWFFGRDLEVLDMTEYNVGLDHYMFLPT